MQRVGLATTQAHNLLSRLRHTRRGLDTELTLIRLNDRQIPSLHPGGRATAHAQMAMDTISQYNAIISVIT